jgi:outer membrane protein assembly factor BamE
MSEVRFSRVALLVLTLAISACSGSPAKPGAVGLFTPYRFDRVQGNVVTSEQLDALKPGYSRQQVRDILGTPLLANLFRDDRWDYAFTYSRQGVAPILRNVSVYFKGESMDHYVADDVPSESAFVAALKTFKPVDKAPLLVATPESLQKFAQTEAVRSAGLDAVAVPAQSALPASPTSYPPLETP